MATHYDPSLLMAGDIILMTQSPGEHGLGAWFDHAIRWATVSPYDHAALVCETPEGHLRIAEALERVQYSPLDKYVANGHVFHVPTTVEQIQKMNKAAASRIGQFYGWEMLFQDAARDILHIDWSPPLKPRELDCSAFVVWCFLQAGIRLTYKPAPSPADIAFSPIPKGERLWDVKSDSSRR